MKAFLFVIAIIVCLPAAAWVGLQIQPRPFPPMTKGAETLETVALPEGLPAPVERFYRKTYGERIPVIQSVVWTGRGTIAPFGFDMPMRFRFYHQAGQDFRSDIDTTIFGLTLFRVTETYIDGHGWAQTPGGVEQGEKMDQANNLRMWAEYATWAPAVLLTDPRVRWEPLDDATAILVVPFQDTEDRFIIRFDPQTGELQYFETMRYQSSMSDKKLWINGAWFEQGKAWAHWKVEAVAYNTDVSTAIRGTESVKIK